MGVIHTKGMQETRSGLETSRGKINEDWNRTINARKVITPKNENSGFILETSQCFEKVKSRV